MTYKEARVKFSLLIAQQLLDMNMGDYTAAFNEGMDRITEKDPTSDHAEHGFHPLGLAMDIDLYWKGTYQVTTEAHKAFGEMWEKRYPLCRWGGRWNDGNHYELNWKK